MSNPLEEEEDAVPAIRTERPRRGWEAAVPSNQGEKVCQEVDVVAASGPIADHAGCGFQSVR